MLFLNVKELFVSVFKLVEIVLLFFCDFIRLFLIFLELFVVWVNFLLDFLILLKIVFVYDFVILVEILFFSCLVFCLFMI